MKKQLIALRGRGSIGKSSTLHTLYRLLVSDPIDPTNPVVKPQSFEAIGTMLDFKAIVKIEGYKVGLVNRGDKPAILKKELDELKRKKCDVIVCAARSKGAAAFDTLLASYDPPYELLEVSFVSGISG